MSEVLTGRILVVDDEKLIRWTVGERLKRNGHEVSTADSGEEALARVVSDSPQLMLLDVRLPGIDGLETLRRALASAPDLRVLMMSAHSTIDVAVQAMKEGAIDFLVKPFTFDDLDKAVQRALGIAATREGIARANPGTAGATEIIVGKSSAMQQLREMVERVAAKDCTVLIEGESGSGKEVVARALHAASSRADGPYLSVNCAALPEQLLESELFGHERGAFTDAHATKRGLFEAAAGGTVVLDEIGEMAQGGQAKLLRLLENHTFRRLGGVTELKTDARVIAATNLVLDRRVEEGRFRPDLFFRLNVVRLRAPALREHSEDVPELVTHFVAHFNREHRCDVRGVSPSAMELLCAYTWPGNVRELRNVIERALILFGTDELRSQHLPPHIQAARPEVMTPLAMDMQSMELEAAERRLLSQAMDKAGGNQTKAARLLGISRDRLRYRLKKHGQT